MAAEAVRNIPEVVIDTARGRSQRAVSITTEGISGIPYRRGRAAINQFVA